MNLSNCIKVSYGFTFLNWIIQIVDHQIYSWVNLPDGYHVDEKCHNSTGFGLVGTFLSSEMKLETVAEDISFSYGLHFYLEIFLFIING